MNNIYKLVIICAVSMTVWVVFGCSKREAAAPKKATPDETSVDAPVVSKHIGVAILGDDTRNLLLKNLAKTFKGKLEKVDRVKRTQIRQGNTLLNLEAAIGKKVATHALVASRANVAVIAVDATQGPRPIVREHITVFLTTPGPKLQGVSILQRGLE